MARLVACLFLLSLACAAPLPATKPATPGAVASPRSALEETLAGLEISFVDPETFDLHRTVGPFRIVRREPGRLEVEGLDPVGRQPSLVTLLERGDEVWAWSRVGPRDYLARLR